MLFVEGALPGERARIALVVRKRRHELARVLEIERSSAERRAARCPHFGLCGGCVTQHASLGAQLAAKEDWVVQNLARIGKVAPERVLPALGGPEWGYRHRARLSVRRVPKKGGVLVGFRERRSSYVADLRECTVLPAHVSALIVPLKELVESLSVRTRLPQIEVAVADNATALVFRHLEPLTDEDHAALRAFAERHGIHVWLQPGGPETAQAFHPAQSDLYYALPEFALRLHFRPTDFTQVNHAVNRALVA
ncbi:MAG: 23S rRNA (uracil(1939)-C(5))-methyltransferase, partial [Burkholderiales bacterium]